MLDIVVRGGTIVDGTGGPSRVGDIGIKGQNISAVGDLSNVDSLRSLDAKGKVVAPGFIDIHSHSDLTLLVDPRAMSQIYQGVTTELVGNCGHGCAPISDPDLVRSNIYGYVSGVEMTWKTMEGYLKRLEEAQTAVNVGTLVPNGNLRLATVGLDERPARADEVAAMVKLLEEGLDAGGFGWSTGLEYPAERACSEDELVSLGRITARHRGLYATHTRNREVQALEAIEEQVRVAERAGCSLQVSHIIPRRGGAADNWQQAIKLVESSRERGVDVTFDSHTRLHGITNLSNAVPPAELSRAPAELADRLRDPAVRAAFKRYPSIISSFGLGGWQNVRLYNSVHRPDWVGKSFAELAPPGGDAWDAIFDVLQAESENPHEPLCTCFSYEEEWLLTTFKHALCMPGSDATALGTDGPLAGVTFLGAFTWAGWFFRRLIRETQTLTLEEGIRRLTSMPADRIGLKGRGRLEPGAWADLSIFDANTFGETGSLTEPNRLAVGMEYVFVNGVTALEGGKLTGARSGAVLRH
jgi:N-acyl-D-amino-acid deacylase